MERVSVSDARRTFAELVNRVAYGNKRITVARHGRDLVAIVPMSDVHRLEELELSPSPASTTKIQRTIAPATPARRPNAGPRP